MSREDGSNNALLPLQPADMTWLTQEGVQTAAHVRPRLLEPMMLPLHSLCYL